METKQFSAEPAINVVLAPGQEKAEVVIRRGEAVKELPKLEPKSIAISGVLGCPVEFLEKRISTGQFQQKDCHVEVNREEVSIRLVINEQDPYLMGIVQGKLEPHPKFLEFGINRNKEWSPTKLGLFFKMNRTFFTEKEVNMALVSQLMNFTATVNQQINQGASERGDRTDNFTQMVNSNLPASFKLRVPLFKGYPAEDIEVVTFANVDGRDVSFLLLSPGARALFEETRDNAIDEQIQKIRTIAPDIAIFEV